jgi:glycosyltransferase involved in cell wall biosynthesis
MSKEAKDSQAPLLSLLLPVYNVAPYLAECIESIISQNAEARFEIVLLDDCSTDGSRQIAERLCRENPDHMRLLLHTENAGLSAARNTLLSAASGEYVWFLDSDDKLFPTALNSLLAILDQHTPDIVLCDYSKDNGPQIGSFDGIAGTLQNDTQALVRGIFSARKMHSWSKISRRTLWADDLRFPVGALFEDIASTPYLLLRARSFYYARQKWIFYRQRHDSILGLISRTKGFDEKGHGHLAGALTGYKEVMARALGAVDPETNFAIAHFLARSYTQIGFKMVRERLLRQSWQKTAQMMGQYQAITESASPMSFAELQTAYVRKGKYTRLLVLRLFRAIAKPPVVIFATDRAC